MNEGSTISLRRFPLNVETCVTRNLTNRRTRAMLVLPALAVALLGVGGLPRTAGYSFAGRSGDCTDAATPTTVQQDPPFTVISARVSTERFLSFQQQYVYSCPGQGGFLFELDKDFPVNDSRVLNQPVALPASLTSIISDSQTIHSSDFSLSPPGCTLLTPFADTATVSGTASLQLSSTTFSMSGSATGSAQVTPIGVPFHPSTARSAAGLNAQVVFYVTGPVHYALTADFGNPPFGSGGVSLCRQDLSSCPVNASSPVSQSGELTPGIYVLSGGSRTDAFVSCFPAGPPCSTASNTSSFNAVLTITPNQTCQVNVTRNGQCDVTIPPKHWGREQYAFHAGTTICGLGCYLTSLSMALNAAGVGRIPSCPDESLLVGNDPGTLNDFMTCDAALLRYTFSDLPSLDNNVNPWVTTRDLGIKLHKRLIFITPPRGTLDSGNDPASATFLAARDFLDAALCDPHPHPVIVGVRGTTHSNVFPGHFVLVRGRQGDDYLIADPAGDPNTPGLPRHTLLSQYGRFEAIGFVQDPTDDISGLNLSLGDNAALLVANNNGMLTGLDVTTGGILQNIPGSAYSKDTVEDDVTGDLPIRGSQLIDIFRPLTETYEVIINGFNLGPYTLGVRAFSQDGTAQPPVSLPGIAGPGSSSSFQIQFSSAQGSVPRVVRMATFQSTLADVRNSLQLGLIDNTGIANSLSQKIQAAMHASGTARTNILRAFKNEVNAQAGNHVTETAAQVLLEDAASLLP